MTSVLQTLLYNIHTVFPQATHFWAKIKMNGSRAETRFPHTRKRVHKPCKVS